MTDSKGHILYNKEKASEGKFAFTTDDQDVFKVCFTSENQGGFQRGMKLLVKIFFFLENSDR